MERVRREGKSYAHPLTVLVVCPQPEPAAPRIGVVAGRSVGGAVERNRAKRLLREAIRAHAQRLAPGWDLILIARAPLAAVKLAQAQAAVQQLLHRAHVLTTSA
jgi:ribonuclease P protein component